MRKAIQMGMVIPLLAAVAAADTFVPSPLLEEHGIDVINETVSRDMLDRELFGNPYATVVLGQTDIYERFPYVESRYFVVVSDPEWNRLLYGELGKSFAAWDGKASGIGAMSEPHGLAVDADGRLYVADTGNRRVVVFETANEFDKLALKPAYVIEDLARPYDVAWSDAGTPDVASDDVLYVVDSGRNEVARYALGASGATRTASIGGLGNGVGRFAGPMAVTVGRSDGANTQDVYVADAHNRRIVELFDNGSDFSWVSSTESESGIITSLDADQHGNIYAADPQAGSVKKYGPGMNKVATWSEGIAGPRDFHVPFINVIDHRSGAKVRSGQGSGVVVEDWTSESGLRLAHFGVDIENLDVSGDDDLAFRYTLTDRADVTAELVDGRGATIASETWEGVDAGDRSGAFAREAIAQKSDGELTLRLTARSTYDGGSDAYAEMKVSTGDEPDIVPRYGLLGNEPNPFNPVTTIRFRIPEGRNTGSLGVYDAGGRLVRTLHEGDFEPGYHSVTWDGTNRTGHAVASGIYLSELDVNGVKQTSKMVLVK
ncbi:MAG: hypothetical protein HKN20_00995 [Gemmatimonadetes bacterium]|nr:hypothetical protein [Gemmatimonadota bacterium]